MVVTDKIKATKYWNPVKDVNLVNNSPNCSDLLPHACQGNMLFAKDVNCLKGAGITHVLSLTRQKVPEEVRQQFAWKQIQVSDTPRTEIRHTFEEAIDFIEDARKRGGKCFIHCRAGVSRSSCVSIAYLMWHKKMKLKESYEYVKERRAIAHPNKGFLNQLINYEKYLFGPNEAGINMHDLGYTVWERTEHLSLNDPLPPLDLCHLNEKRVAEEFVRRFGRKNEFMTMDAGLGGKMELHMVELFSIHDFEWLDAVIRSVLSQYNASARAALAEQHRIASLQQAHAQMQMPGGAAANFQQQLQQQPQAAAAQQHQVNPQQHQQQPGKPQ